MKVAILFLGMIAVTCALIPECPRDGNGNERIPDSEDCGKFYYCKDFVPYPAYCPPRHYFDVKTLTCVDAAKATCAETATPAPEIPEEPTPSVDCPVQHGSDDNVLLPNPKDCKTFYQCVWGEPILLECPKGLHFNNYSKRCDYPNEAHCAVNKIL